MMDVLFYFALITVVYVSLLFPWLAFCNMKTASQRRMLLMRASELAYNDKGDWGRFYRRYERLSYDEHFWMLVTFRDPMKIYKLED